MIFIIYGLYDLDFWHSSAKKVPNLELMQLYTYLYNNNNTPIFLSPNKKISKNAKYYYFKERISTKIPRTVSLIGERKEQIGYGFFKEAPQLSQEIINTQINYLPYDAWENKFTQSFYKSIKRSSYIRFETQNFVNYKATAATIYFADQDLFYKKDIDSFLQEYKNHNYDCVYGINIYDEETLKKFDRYTNIFKTEFVIDFDWSEDLFLSNINEPKYNFKFKYKNNEQSLIKLIKYILICKHLKRPLSLDMSPKNSLERNINNWAYTRIPISYKDFYRDNATILNDLNNQKSDIRLLLKQNPQTINFTNLK